MEKFSKRFFGHLKTILKHKKYVFFYMRHLGYGWQGFMHDMSKFSPVEFFEGVKYWTGYRSPILVAKEKNGISYAWLHHRGRNKHHYEYWIDKLDNGGVPQKMPFKYVIEMVCDWLAAGKSYENEKGNIFLKEEVWWKEKKKTAKIHPDTVKLIDRIFWNLNQYVKYWKIGDMTMEVIPIKTAETKTLETVRTFLKHWENVYNEVETDDDLY